MIEAQRLDGKIVIKKCLEERLCKSLIQRGYIREGFLDPLEAAYQAWIGKLLLENLKGWDAALMIMIENDIPLKLFIVYSDLRRRGRIVYSGPRKNTLITVLGDKKMEILVLEEGETITVRGILDWSIIASGEDRRPIIAVVDRNGSVTYYEARVTSSLL